MQRREFALFHFASLLMARVQLIRIIKMLFIICIINATCCPVDLGGSSVKGMRLRLRPTITGGMQWPAAIVRCNTGSCCNTLFTSPLTL